MAKWVKTTPYRDYKETTDRKNCKTNRVIHILREAHALGVIGKHAGSKPLNKVIEAIARAHKAVAPVKEEIKTEEV